MDDKVINTKYSDMDKAIINGPRLYDANRNIQ